MAQGFGPETAEGLETLQVFLDGFDAGSQHRGRSYFKGGRVSRLTQTGNQITAHVRGSYEYGVSLYITAKGWHSECTCPLESDCKHVYATGLAWLKHHNNLTLPGLPAINQGDPSKQKPIPTLLHLQPGEQPLVNEFAATTGQEPDRHQLAYLRNLVNVHRSLTYHGWFDFNALRNLAPADQRNRIHSPYNSNPFQDWFDKPPSNPLHFWPFVALYFHENAIKIPGFMVPFGSPETALAARSKHQHEIALRAWRQTFAQLDARTNAVPVSPVRQILRLRLTPNKPRWEIARENGPFAPLPANDLRDYLHNPGDGARAFDTASNVLLSHLRDHRTHTSRTNLNLRDNLDAELLATLLENPGIRHLIVDPEGNPVADDPRTVTWNIEPHPSDPALTRIGLVLSDGSPLPGPLLYLPGQDSAYLCENRLRFLGLPPLHHTTNLIDRGDAFEIPAAALATPEAGRFAARNNIRIPGDETNRYRYESLRARLRARLGEHRAHPGEEVLVVELHALSPDNLLRARHHPAEGWQTSAPGIQPPAEAEHLLHDFAPLDLAADYLTLLKSLSWNHWVVEGGAYTADPTSTTFAENFSAWIIDPPPGLIVELSPELAALAAPPTRARVEFNIGESSDTDWFDVHTSLRVEDTELSEKEIELLTKARGRWVRLGKRGWRRLSVDSETDASTRAELDRLGLALDPEVLAGKKSTHRYHTLQLVGSDAAARDEKLAAKLRDRVATLRAIAPPPLPDGIRATLRPYQEDGYHFLAHLSSLGLGGVLADDMGLGKTLQTLAWLLWLRDSADRKKKPFRALVVCPKSVVPNWQIETERFTPALSTARAASGEALPAGDLLVINYAQLRLRAEDLKKIAWDAVILDEGQNIKNPASTTARTARELSARHRFVLTGTPIENRLLDLWSLVAFAQPGLLGSQAGFQRQYREKDDPDGARSRLATRVRPFLLRRTKSQVAKDLPPRIEEEILCELDGKQRALYDAELKRARQMLLKVKTARQFDAERFNILQSLLRLRQICCDPRLIGFDETEKKRRKDAESTAEQKPIESAKIEALLDTLEPLVAEGHRVLVFSQFVTMLELIRDELVVRSIGHLMLTGQTENRQELVNQFQSPEGPPVFLLSLKAAGSGLNLTAASYVVLYDPWWNPAVEAQAIDRTHRIGQKSQVIAYRLIAKDTIEEKIRALQRQKATLAAAVVKEESLATVLDLESLRSILAD